MKQKLEYHKFSGLQIFCRKCKTTIHSVSKSKSKCDHPFDKQVYKAIIKPPDGGGKRKTLILKSKSFDEAVIELLAFKKEVINGTLLPKVNSKPQLLIECMAMYIDYTNDYDIPHHLKKHLTPSYIKTIQGFLHEFLDFVNDKGYYLKEFKVTNISDKMVGLYCEHLDKKHQSNYTYNGKIKALRTFFNYLINEEYYNIRNVWKKVKLKSQGSTNISISSKDFYNLLNVISPKDSMVQIGKKRRNMYKVWLKDLIMLKAFSGRRNEELFEMRWNMIHYEDDKPVYVESPNIKINKLQNNFEKRDFQFSYIPIGSELKSLLNQLGMKNKRGSSEYIIAPSIETRRTLKEQASKCFTFHFNKLNSKDSIQLKHLRQTYITQEDIFINSRISMQHSNYKTTSKHYVNKKEVAKEMVKNDFRIFELQDKRHSRRTLQ